VHIRPTHTVDTLHVGARLGGREWAPRIIDCEESAAAIGSEACPRPVPPNQSIGAHRGSEEGSYLRLIELCITQLWA